VPLKIRKVPVIIFRSILKSVAFNCDSKKILPHFEKMSLKIPFLVALCKVSPPISTGTLQSAIKNRIFSVTLQNTTKNRIFSGILQSTTENRIFCGALQSATKNIIISGTLQSVTKNPF
jgi:hypothetical protein